MSKQQPIVLFSSGVNIKQGTVKHPRIDEEVQSLRQLIHPDSRIVMFNHQGDYRKGTAKPTPWLGPLFTERLQYPVKYFAETIGPSARDYVERCQPGSVNIMGNTRLYPEEQNNDTMFARSLAEFGDYLVIGGFCKLHRQNASNCAIKDFISWRYSSGVLAQLNHLEQLYINLFQNKKTILLLGGNKKEKLKFLFSKTRVKKIDRAVIGGMVLNSVLREQGFSIGRSKFFKIELSSVLNFPVYMPKFVIVKNVSCVFLQRRITEIRDDEIIVDFLFDKSFFNDISHGNEYAFFASGPLSLPQSQYSHVAYKLLKMKHIDGLFMGGDTLSEVDTFSFSSSGGGAALHFFLGNYQ